MKLKFLSLLFCLALFSCKSSQQNQNAVKSLESGKFEVLSIDGKDVSGTRLNLTLNTEEHRISGYTGCNNFGATFTTEGDQIDFDYARVTKAYCEGKMELERQFLGTLQKVKAYVYTGTDLVLQTAEGGTLITATRIKE